MLQSQVVNALRGSWRPLTPLARGALPPLAEPPVDLPSFPTEYSIPPVPAMSGVGPSLSAACLPVASSANASSEFKSTQSEALKGSSPVNPEGCDPELDGESVSSSDSSTGSSASDSSSGERGSAPSLSPSPVPEAGDCPDKLLLNRPSGVFHAAIPCGDEVPARRRTLLDEGLWRAACGALLSQDVGAYALLDSAPWVAEPCCRGACARRLVGFSRRVPSPA